MSVYFSWVVRFFLLLGPRAHLVFLSQDEDLQRHGGIDGKHFAGPSSMLPRGPNEFNGCVLAGWKEPPRLSPQVNLEDLTAFANSLEAREDMFS